MIRGKAFLRELERRLESIVEEALPTRILL
jgi:hypothetical protein